MRVVSLLRHARPNWRPTASCWTFRSSRSFRAQPSRPSVAVA